MKREKTCKWCKHLHKHGPEEYCTLNPVWERIHHPAKFFCGQIAWSKEAQEEIMEEYGFGEVLK